MLVPAHPGSRHSSATPPIGLVSSVDLVVASHPVIVLVFILSDHCFSESSLLYTCCCSWKWEAPRHTQF